MSFRWRLAQFFEIRWWQRYLNRKNKGDYLGWKRRYWDGFLEKSAVNIPAKARVLDAGCGPAGVFLSLQAQQVDAIDPLLAAYKAHLTHFNPEEYPWVRFYPSSIEDFHSDQAYDLVCCLNAINHVRNIEQAFDRLRALTRAGGTLLVSVDAHRYSWINQVFRWIPGDILHPHQYGLKAYQALLENHDCRVKKALVLEEGLIFDYILLVAEKNDQN
jgi:2-polyprenyl-3-methyl-5-hydroxy-6-metoxy-1,4-benzoquinol methylase